MAEPTFTYDVDAGNRVITLRLFGREPSAYYADQVIAAYHAVPEVWRYNRIADHRKFTGLVVRDDLARIAAAWAELTAGQDVHSRVAFVTRDELTRARVAAHNDLFPDQDRRAFTSMAEAMEWVMEPVMVK